ncbi:uncharacterized protein (TIGR04255 family) [Paraburkholderia sp. JPY465]|uniref:TIGR04255 family protein n=1 Tax=Paraburkholderia sp. JPY465 TaxID=3042285 RepID=UPI003D22D697
MNGRMANAPVYYALLQAQFNPIPAMEKYAGEVQDLLRRDGYTLFEEQAMPQLEFVFEANDAPPVPKVGTLKVWRMTTADRTSSFVLSPTFIAFHTTHYDTRRQFLPNGLRGLEHVHKVVGLDHVSRLGLRYLDAVQPREAETVDQYLAGGLRGVQFGAVEQSASSEQVFETQPGVLADRGILVARVHRAVAPLGFPPDVAPHGLVIKDRFAKQEPQRHAVIDTDHFVQGRFPLDFASLASQLEALHRDIRRAFEAIVTPHALKAWS